MNILLLIQGAAQDQAGFGLGPRPAPPPGRSAGSRDQDPQMAGPPPLEGRPDPPNLVSCLNTPIWDGIRAQDPDPALLPRGGAARGPGPNPALGPPALGPPARAARPGAASGLRGCRMYIEYRHSVLFM